MEAIRVSASQVWTMKQCQEFQNRYLPTKTKKKETSAATAAPAAARTVVTEVGILEAHKNHCSDVAATTNSQQQELQQQSNHHHHHHHHHGGNNYDKRLQAERMVKIFLQTLGESLFSSSQQLNTETNNNDSIRDIARSQMQQQQRQLQTYLNQGSGVLDIAGGSGYVSMALALQGIQSTVIDARSSVGKLPGKDRKLYRRKLQEQARQKRETISQRTTNESRMMMTMMNEWEYCQPPIVPFNAHRAWFGTKPSGVDQSFRHPDEEEIPTLSLLNCIGNSSSSNGRRLLQASALVGLHPDEATADIVKQAVQHRIPFMVVPCCVFARLFPHRRKRDGNPVNTYEDLLEYLQEMDPSIQRMTLPLEGRNIALWSTF
ncbi:methyltransferase domain containing protein [Nitzschia inconspicua]|uniref:Methyltransferase domain containing protein n=1 Tax=Nitzschia inconspicua TaxID=303405 RepID=A0A9K3KX82_9STRA|nr:methyltransferase domain containing protein [Nitzschia inconspicua]